MFRHLTRGKNEKIQIRNVKNADYPQKGCKEMLIPSVGKTNCTQSGHIVAIRTTSTDNPSRIDSHDFHFNQSVGRNSLHIPYLNLAKGTRGQTVIPFRMQGPQPGNIAETRMYKSVMDQLRYISRVHNANLFMVWSYSSSVAFSNTVFAADTRIINNSTRREAMSKIIGYGYPELTHSSYRFRDMIFYNSSGGVKTGAAIKRPNSTFCNSHFRHYQTTDSFISPANTLPGLAALRLVQTSMTIHGAVQYAFTSTNENANAAWLLNQRTQYGRITNPIQ